MWRLAGYGRSNATRRSCALRHSRRFLLLSGAGSRLVANAYALLAVIGVACGLVADTRALLAVIGTGRWWVPRGAAGCRRRRTRHRRPRLGRGVRARRMQGG